MSLVDVNNNKIEDPNDPKGFYSAPVDSFKGTYFLRDEFVIYKSLLEIFSILF